METVSREREILRKKQKEMLQVESTANRNKEFEEIL